jgi:hypothetical protein
MQDFVHVKKFGEGAIARAGTEGDAYIEIRKRGIVGWITLIVFLAWNFLMVFWLVTAISATNEVIAQAGGAAERAGGQIGQGLGIGALLLLWLIGAVITGLFALIFRGRKSIIRRKEMRR